MSSNASASGPSLVIRALWFVFVGWWLTGLWLSIAWLLNLTIIGIPLGIKMINVVPKVLSLKSPQRDLVTDPEGNLVESDREQYNLLVRGVWFLLVGWWASALWTGIAYLLTLTIVGIPIAVIMYNKLPFVVSLYRY